MPAGDRAGALVDFRLDAVSASLSSAGRGSSRRGPCPGFSTATAAAVGRGSCKGKPGSDGGLASKGDGGLGLAAGDGTGVFVDLRRDPPPPTAVLPLPSPLAPGRAGTGGGDRQLVQPTVPPLEVEPGDRAFY